MLLDRAIIKSQAKMLIRGRVLVLFAITLVVTLLVSGTSIVKSINNTSNIKGLRALSGITERIEGIDDPEELEDYLEDFEESAKPSNGIIKTVVNTASRLGTIINIICMPLFIMLCGLYLALIRGTSFELYDEFRYVFRNTFNKDYFDRLLLTFLRTLFTYLWALLFIIPGIVYFYKVKLALFIKADYPELTWKDCLEASKKMTNNHKGELFTLDLSFIGWFFLIPVTFGVASVYILPYYHTTMALYYENFKQRALATGEMNETDFMTEAQKYALFIQQNPNGGAFNPVYSQPPVQQNTAYVPPVQPPQYGAAVQPQNPYTPPSEPVQASADNYCPPAQPEAAVTQVINQEINTENSNNETF